jgi:hypothetical protein
MDLLAHLTLEKWVRFLVLQILRIEQQIVEPLCSFLLKAPFMRQR